VGPDRGNRGTSAGSPNLAEDIARLIDNREVRQQAYAWIALALPATDADRITRLVNEAERAAVPLSNYHLHDIEAKLAPSDADRAERAARSITDARPDLKAKALLQVAMSLSPAR
jgi:hypothetical protein